MIDVDKELKVLGDHLFKLFVIAERLVKEVIKPVLQIQ